MNKKTQMIVGVLAVGGAAYFLYQMNKKTKQGFANAVGKSYTTTGKIAGCKVYAGSCNAPVGTILSSWNDGGGVRGIIVSNNYQSCTICPVSNTPTGMPIQA